MLSTAIRNAEVEKKGELSSDEALAVVLKQVRTREESAMEYEKAGRHDLANKEKAEAQILSHWLPARLSDAEIEGLVSSTIAEVGGSGPSDMGKVMGALMPKIRGRADGRQVSEMVKSRLSGGAA